MFQKLKDRKISAVGLLSLGFLCCVAVGTILLMLPFSSADGQWTGFVDSMFVATSASCVTGLVPFSTGEHWSMFGQIVILVLIQIGGLGFMTLITFVMRIFRRNVSLYSQTVLVQSAGSYSIGEVMPMLKKIILFTLFFEASGAALLWLCFRETFGDRAVYMGIFHSISAFCNAGFDIFAFPGGSITGFANDPRVLLILSGLILAGGLGFVVWTNVVESGFRPRKMYLHTKLVLAFSFVAVVIPAILFFLFDLAPWNAAPQFEGMSFGDRVVNSLFLSVSPRTAGFNAVDLTKLSPPGKIINIVLMFIGGNSGSTAGGVKLTTVVVVLANLVASARGRADAVMFRKAIPGKIVRQSSALFNSYLILIVFATVAIACVEPLSLEQVLFEVTSAIGTVGLSLDVTPTLGIFSKFVIMFLMYFGRLGAFALFDLLFRNDESKAIKYPEGRLLVG